MKILGKISILAQEYLIFKTTLGLTIKVMEKYCLQTIEII